MTLTLAICAWIPLFLSCCTAKWAESNRSKSTNPYPAQIANALIWLDADKRWRWSNASQARDLVPEGPGRNENWLEHLFGKVSNRNYPCSRLAGNCGSITYCKTQRRQLFEQGGKFNTRKEIVCGAFGLWGVYSIYIHNTLVWFKYAKSGNKFALEAGMKTAQHAKRIMEVTLKVAKYRLKNIIGIY